MHVFKVLCARTSFRLPGQFKSGRTTFGHQKVVRPDRFFPRTKIFVTVLLCILIVRLKSGARRTTSLGTRLFPSLIHIKYILVFTVTEEFVGRA